MKVKKKKKKWLRRSPGRNICFSGPFSVTWLSRGEWREMKSRMDFCMWCLHCATSQKVCCSLSPIVSNVSALDAKRVVSATDEKPWSCVSTANVDFSKLTIKSLHQLLCRLFIYVFPWHKPLRALSAIPQRWNDVHLELLSHSFSLEISIITKPPTVKRLSKNARHLATQKSCGLTRGRGRRNRTCIHQVKHR